MKEYKSRPALKWKNDVNMEKAWKEAWKKTKNFNHQGGKILPHYFVHISEYHGTKSNHVRP
jgi:hypothetical protein